MKTENLRRPYTAPTAELVCLAPSFPVASNKSWQWGSTKTHYWDTSTNKWGSSSFVASVTGVAECLGDDLLTDEEIKK